MNSRDLIKVKRINPTREQMLDAIARADKRIKGMVRWNWNIIKPEILIFRRNNSINFLLKEKNN